MQGSPWELVSAQEKGWRSPQEEEPSCFLMITRMGATLESDYLGWPVTQSGSMNKYDVNWTVKPAARGIEGKERRKR